LCNKIDCLGKKLSFGQNFSRGKIVLEFVEEYYMSKISGCFESPCIYRVDHFNQYMRISRKGVFSKNVSNKSCMALREKNNDIINLIVDGTTLDILSWRQFF